VKNRFQSLPFKCNLQRYTTVMTQYFRSQPCLSFAMLGIWGMVVVGLSVFMGYGLVIWCGVPFTSLAQAGPFIFLGVGVDDVIVMLEAFRLARRTLPGGGTVESRAEFATERAGVSISITSLTNFIAFALGSITVIPAVNWFCIYASVAIICDFLIQMAGLALFSCSSRFHFWPSAFS
jgi:predicted RND superfamily exporter protein